MTLSLPPFTRAVMWLVGINTGIYLLRLVLSRLMPEAVLYAYRYLELVPTDVVQHGRLWELVTYSFLHEGFWHLFGNMLGLWMFGSAIENAWGTRRFVELYSIGVVGAAITTVAVAYTNLLGHPDTAT